MSTNPIPTPLPFTQLSALARTQGLQALAVLTPPPELPADGLDQMLADGVGDMTWLAKHRALRLNPTGLLSETLSEPGAIRIVCAALHYDATAGGEGLRRARYAAGVDYHPLLRRKLALLARLLETAVGRPCRQRAVVDSAPLNERTLAHLAGLGWIGRNALLISPQTGSYRVLGFLLSDAPLAEHHAGQDAKRCGSCRRCETGCPTRAIVAGRVLSERCISYLTIEHHGVIPRALAECFQGWWFGCDVCQEVCPWNRFAPPAEDPRLLARASDHEAALLTVTAENFDQHFAGRAVRRIGYERLRRNLLTALFSLGRHGDAAGINDPLPLVQAQRCELGLA